MLRKARERVGAGVRKARAGVPDVARGWAPVAGLAAIALIAALGWVVVSQNRVSDRQERVEASVGEIQRQMTNLSVKLSGPAGTEVTTQLDTLGSQLEEISRGVKAPTTKSEHAKIVSDVSDVSDEVSKLSGRMQSLREKVDRLQASAASGEIDVKTR